MKAKIKCESSDCVGQGFLNAILSKINDITQHLDQQINILIGLSAVIFVFVSATYERHETSLPLLIMAIFSAASALVGIFAIHPPRKWRKRGQAESILYNKNIAAFSSSESYTKALEEITSDPEQIFKEYAKEIFNLCKYYYRPKRRLFHMARNLFFTGIILSLLVFLATL